MNLVEELSKWDNLKIQEDEIKVKQNVIKENIAKYMHENKESSLSSPDENGQVWSMTYQTKNSRSCDYDTLESILTEEDFSDVVKTTTSEFLVIRKAKKSSGTKNDYSKKAPKTSKPNLSKAPTGVII